MVIKVFSPAGHIHIYKYIYLAWSNSYDWELVACLIKKTAEPTPGGN